MTHLIIIPTDSDPILRLADSEADALRIAEKAATGALRGSVTPIGYFA